MELFKGRPEKTEGRLTRELRTADVINVFLPAVGHNFKTVHLIGED